MIATGALVAPMIAIRALVAPMIATRALVAPMIAIRALVAPMIAIRAECRNSGGVGGNKLPRIPALGVDTRRQIAVSAGPL
jgi:hypothetical protein